MLLMEEAGRVIAAEVAARYKAPRPLLLLCGKGNNGGDGYAIARRLAESYPVQVLELSVEPGSSEAKAMRAALAAYDLTPQLLSLQALQEALKTPDLLVVDALFGSGLTRPLEGELAACVTCLNAAGVAVVSVDIPSGLAADDAAPFAPHVQAALTVQLAAPKRSSLLYPARHAFGVQVVKDIGIPQKILEAHSQLALLDDAALQRFAPTRPAEAHKYSVGTVLVVAGSSRYLGAAELACRAALRAGAGLVTLAAEERLPCSWPEIVFEPLDWQADPGAQLAKLSPSRAQARVIGPGLDAGTPEAPSETAQHLPELIALSPAVTVVDAGALLPTDAWFAAIRAHGRCVLTPHVGEAATLLGAKSQDILRAPIAAAQTLAQQASACTVLKGATTVIAAPTGRVALLCAGHPGMATAGMGDVLSGLLGAWCAALGDEVDVNELFNRVCAAATLHAKAGEQAAKRYGVGVLASDVIDALAAVNAEINAEINAAVNVEVAARVTAGVTRASREPSA